MPMSEKVFSVSRPIARPDIAPKSHQGRVSGWGFGLGYLGSAAGLLAAALIESVGWRGLFLIGGFLLPSLVAAGASYLMFKVGFALIGSFARPVPEPPPPGELRRVKLQFRCSLCGTEVRMTVANDEMPEPPRHCMEDMEFMTPRFE